MCLSLRKSVVECWWNLITALSFRAWGIYSCCYYNMLFPHSSSCKYGGCDAELSVCVCMCRKGRPFCLCKWKSICFLCWRCSVQSKCYWLWLPWWAMVSDGWHIPVLPVLSWAQSRGQNWRCIFYFDDCAKAVQSLPVSSVRNGWEGIYWESFLPCLLRVTAPMQGPGGTSCRLLKNHFLSRNPAAEKDCFMWADLGLLTSVFYFWSTQVTQRMLWLSCQKMGSGHTKGTMFLWATALYIFSMN